jgi:hypothetical protein
LSAEGSSPEPSSGSTALFSWGDFDGDERLDLAAVNPDGRLQVLVCVGEGRFEEVTERVGLASVEGVALALWADYDGDGRLDLFVGARTGRSRLFRNDEGIFVDMSAASGLASQGPVQEARWLDHDGDGRLDLFLATAERNELFRGLEGGFFECSVLPVANRGTDSLGSWFGPVEEGTEAADAPGTGLEQESRARRTPGNPTPVSSSARESPSGAVIPLVLSPGCIDSITDQANPAACMEASSVPTLGRLYPLSANLFVASTGNVGIGTTGPTAKLHVAGTARITDTLTLAPAGDQALDISSGSLYMGGALFMHTKGAFNTALGVNALSSVFTGAGNTANGYRALSYYLRVAPRGATIFQEVVARVHGA